MDDVIRRKTKNKTADGQHTNRRTQTEPDSAHGCDSPARNRQSDASRCVRWRRAGLFFSVYWKSAVFVLLFCLKNSKKSNRRMRPEIILFFIFVLVFLCSNFLVVFLCVCVFCVFLCLSRQAEEAIEAGAHRVGGKELQEFVSFLSFLTKKNT